MNLFQNDKYYRLKEIIAPLGPLPVSRSTWYSHRKNGVAPSGKKLSERITAYLGKDLNDYAEKGWT